MINIVKYHLCSRNKELYTQIAENKKRSAIHVYRLAHGRKPKNKIDRDIIAVLIEKKIVRIMAPWEK